MLKTNRSLLVVILLSIITCGIYSWIFIYQLASDVNTSCAGDGEETAGLLKFILLSLITCGIYALFWYYKMGENCDKIKGSTNSGIIYLVLGIFGMGIVNYCLIQDTINKAIAG